MIFFSTEILTYDFVNSRIFFFQRRCKKSKSVPLDTPNIGTSPPFSLSLSVTLSNREFTGFNSKKVIRGGSRHHKGASKKLQEGFSNPQLYTQQNWPPLHSRSSKTMEKRRVWRKMFLYFGIVSPVLYIWMVTNCVRWEHRTEGKDMDYLVQPLTVNLNW